MGTSLLWQTDSQLHDAVQRQLESEADINAKDVAVMASDGVITATLAEPGQVVAIGQAVARLAHRGEMEAVVALPETRNPQRVYSVCALLGERFARLSDEPI